MPQQRFGIRSLTIDGEVHRVKGNVAYNLGGEARETVVGADTIHGYTVTRRPAHLELEITDSDDLDVFALSQIQDATIAAELENDKVIVLRDAVQVGEATANSEEGNISVRFEAPDGEEV